MIFERIKLDFSMVLTLTCIALASFIWLEDRSASSVPEVAAQLETTGAEACDQFIQRQRRCIELYGVDNPTTLRYETMLNDMSHRIAATAKSDGKVRGACEKSLKAADHFDLLAGC